MWRRVHGRAAMVATATVGALLLPVLSASQVVSSRNGGVLYATYCASCHGTNGRGNGPVAGVLRTTPANLTALAKNNGGVFPAERTRRIIDGRESRIRAHGPFDMPVWGDAFARREGLSEAEISERIDAIVRYLDSIQERSGH